MKLLYKSLFCLLLLVTQFLPTGNAIAATVAFQGLLFGVSGGPINAIAPPRQFGLQFDVNLAGIVTPGIGAFVVDPAGVNLIYGITGGTFALVDGVGPASDTLVFTIGVAGPEVATLTSIINLPSTTIGSAIINQANINAFISAIPAPGGNFTYDGPGGNDFSGQILGVPEPSSCLALLGIVGWVGLRCRRNRMRNA